MAHRHATTQTSMKPYQVNGQDEEAVLSISHANLI
jgi:hypothetical protein